MPITDPEARRRSAVAFVRQAKPRPVASGPRAPVQADDGAVVDLAAVKLKREKLALTREEIALEQQLGTLCLVSECLSAGAAAGAAFRRGFETLIADTLLHVPREARGAVQACLLAAEETIGEEVGSALASPLQGQADRDKGAVGAA